MAKLGNVINEILKWDPKEWRREFALSELENESFRHRVNSVPAIKDQTIPIERKTTYMRNVITQGIRMKNKFEVIEQRSRVPFNADLPDNIQLDEMGIGGWSNREDFIWPDIDPVTRHYRRSPWLDHMKMSDRHFRESCITANGRLHFLYPMAYNEVTGPSHLRPETIQDWFAKPCRCKSKPDCGHRNTQIDFIDCQSLAKFFKRMNMDRPRVIRTIFGYQASNDQWKQGLKSLDAEIIKEIAADWEELEQNMPKLSIEGEPRSLEDERQYYHDISYRLIDKKQTFLASLSTFIDSPLKQRFYIEHMARSNYDNEKPDQSQLDFLIQRGFGVDQDEEDQVYEDEDFDPVGDGWTAMPLSDGNDTVKWRWISCIKTAGVRRLQAWKRVMYKISDRLTYLQLQDLWSRIWQRQAELADLIKPKITPEVREILNEMPHLTANQAKALIFAYEQGGAFERYTSFDFQDNGDHELVFYLWNAYRELIND